LLPPGDARTVEPAEALIGLGVDFVALPTSAVRLPSRTRRLASHLLALTAPRFHNRLMPEFGVPAVDRARGSIWFFKTGLLRTRRIPTGASIVVDLDDLEERVLRGHWSPALLMHRLGILASRRRALAIAEWSLVCSDLDRRRLGHHSRVAVLANTYLVTERPVQPIISGGSSEVVAVVGSMGYDPNREGVEWFVSRCWASVRSCRPAAHLRLVGKSGHLLAGIESEGVVVIDSPADIVEVLEDVTVFAVPIFRGSGTRVKILEAMALGKPVVSTRLGAEGLDRRDVARDCVTPTRRPA